MTTLSERFRQIKTQQLKQKSPVARRVEEPRGKSVERQQQRGKSKDRNQQMDRNQRGKSTERNRRAKSVEPSRQSQPKSKKSSPQTSPAPRKRSLEDRLGKKIQDRLGKTVFERLGKPMAKGSMVIGSGLVLGPKALGGARVEKKRLPNGMILTKRVKA